MCRGSKVPDSSAALGLTLGARGWALSSGQALSSLGGAASGRSPGHDPMIAWNPRGAHGPLSSWVPRQRCRQVPGKHCGGTPGPCGCPAPTPIPSKPLLCEDLQEPGPPPWPLRQGALRPVPSAPMGLLELLGSEKHFKNQFVGRRLDSHGPFLADAEWSLGPLQGQPCPGLRRGVARWGSCLTELWGWELGGPACSGRGRP